ncbi:hypothetical protein Bbelb_228690 [Branchiostoma belcheri]|nr:hypothetical protein Bbelb_228690 [Branchiostoma belcheri]
MSFSQIVADPDTGADQVVPTVKAVHPIFPGAKRAEARIKTSQSGGKRSIEPSGRGLKMQMWQMRPEIRREPPHVSGFIVLRTRNSHAFKYQSYQPRIEVFKNSPEFPQNYRRLELVATKHSWGIITRKLQTTPAIKCAKIECNKSFDEQPELVLLCQPTHLHNRYLEPAPPAGPSSTLEFRSGTNSQTPLWVTSTTTDCSPLKSECIDTSFIVIENTWQLTVPEHDTARFWINHDSGYSTVLDAARFWMKRGSGQSIVLDTARFWIKHGSGYSPAPDTTAD